MNTLTEADHRVRDFAPIHGRIASTRLWCKTGSILLAITAILPVFFLVCSLLPCNPATELARPKLAALLKAADCYLANGQAEEALNKCQEAQQEACPAIRNKMADVSRGRAEELSATGDFEAAARACTESFQAVGGGTARCGERTPPPPLPPSPQQMDQLSKIMVNGTSVTPGARIAVSPVGMISGVLEPVADEPRTIVVSIYSGAVMESYEVASNGGKWAVQNVHFRPPAKVAAETQVEISVRRTAGEKAGTSAVLQFQVDVARPRIVSYAECRGTSNCPTGVMLGRVDYVMDQDEKLILKLAGNIPGTATATPYCVFAEVVDNNWRTPPISHTGQSNVRFRLQQAGLVSRTATFADCSAAFETVVIH